MHAEATAAVAAAAANACGGGGLKRELGTSLGAANCMNGGGSRGGVELAGGSA